jgi:diaminohydroxyphosphoribosylaminopyrimidine deaminase/5-amino-6-(5-phosphoribosylamino)uracil reductase
MSTQEDEQWISRTIKLALQAKGQTSPNPMVGAVILDKDGIFAAEGYHQKAGSDHAEIVALKKVGSKALGGTLYVNLEPCSHYGQTPPCTEAIINAGIQRVVIGTLDPNPKVNGQGLKRLKDASIKVDYNVLQNQCEELNKFFFYWIRTGKPWVSLKIAATLDGKIALPNQESLPDNERWITNLEARKRVHKLRSEFDAVLTGSGTVLADNPQLTVRLVQGRNPIRIVLDRNLRCKTNNKIFDSNSQTLLFTNEEKLQEAKQARFNNVEISGWNGDLNDLLLALGKRGILSVLVESGSQLNTAFVKNALFNEIIYFANTRFFGKTTQLPLAFNEDFPELKIGSVEVLDNNLVLFMTSSTK